jgi:hypothetical protein
MMNDTDSVVAKRQQAALVAGLVILSGLLPALLFVFFGGAQAAREIEQRRIPALEQAALVYAVYLVKPLYMLLALAALLAFWKHIRPALRGALLFFLLGETACAINILFFFYESTAWEYLHSYLMVVCLGFLAYALIEAADHNLLHFSDPHVKCALLGTCKGCVKYRRGACILRRLFQWALPMVAVVALMPLMAQPRPLSYNVLVFGFVRNLSHALPIQIYEIRFSPLAALALLVVSWTWLAWSGQTQGGMQVAKIFLAAALGYLGFAFMRLAFSSFYGDDLVWFVFWEELTELVLVVGIIVAVWLLQPEAGRALRARLAQFVSGG